MPAYLETITLSVHPDLPSAAARRSLASWLRAEDRLRDRVPPARPDGADPLRVAVDDAGDVMVLVQAVAGWLIHRREDATVTLALPGGSSAELDVRRARDMDQVTTLIDTAVRAMSPA
ncbi:effector-associated constant component EACC1 [Micromonospora endolithica]|uniref:Uncharacterized protein n=1 Tax=Micromonospora endolithica TaxID=230091 RepID=A0A3A9ZHH1_9ACTN|nr:hypothetical protein [Micromonospora endolithica]RKN47710.1 hypothetical protein D7223_13235 [Micromonospora endolithica]TWJ21383.1 hypothetical protein JD76_01493 [Micromonospora endolithica]